MLPALLVTLLFIQGCSETTSEKPKRSKAERTAAAQEALHKPLVPRSYRIGQDQLQVIEVPVQDSSGFVDVQRCFVWRDGEYKTASLSCSQTPDLVVSDPHAVVR